MAVQQQLTWGHSPAAWNAAKQEGRKILEGVAEAQTTITYGDMSRKISSIAFEPDGHDFHALLGRLSEDSDAEGNGMISALVVHKGDLRPGHGFFLLAAQLHRDVSDADQCWINELKRVHRKFSR